MKHLFLAVIPLVLGLTTSLFAERGEFTPLRQSTIVEAINIVEVLAGPDLEARSVESGDLFSSPDFLQTGRRSRARLEAEDGTVTRVGSNTLFSFSGEDRTINLERGSLLFHSPEGRGGGTIVTASATASVVGTTMVVVATADGGFKVLVLEGTARITFPDGTIRILGAGQMTFVQPGRPETGGAGPVVDFDLETLTENSALVQGFGQPLDSLPQIRQAVDSQQRDIDTGILAETGTLILHAERDRIIGLDFSASNDLPRVSSERQRTDNGDDPEDTAVQPTRPGSDPFRPENGEDPDLPGGGAIRIIVPEDTRQSISQNGPSTELGDGPTNGLVLDSENDLAVWKWIQPGSVIFDTDEVIEREGDALHLQSTAGDLIATRFSFSAPHSVKLLARNLVSLDASSVSANFIEIRGGEIQLNDVQFAPHSGMGQLEMVADNLLQMTRSDLTAFGSIRMSAETLALANVQFSSNSQLIELRSANGMLAPNPNTGQSALAGYVNFIREVTVDGNPAQNYVSVDFGGNATGPALIQIAPRTARSGHC